MDETTTTYETTPEPAHGIVLTQEAQYYLNEGAGWARFLGITGFVFCGLIILLALSIGSILNYLAQLSPRPSAMPGVAGNILGVTYGLSSLLYFFPALYLFQFGTKAKKGIVYQDLTDITAAIVKLKSFLKFFGILTIIMLGFIVLALIGIIAGTAAMHNKIM